MTVTADTLWDTSKEQPALWLSTLVALLQAHLRAHPQGLAAIERRGREEHTLSFDTLYTQSISLAALLQDFEATHEPVVLLCARAHPIEATIALWGCWLAGTTPTPLFVDDFSLCFDTTLSEAQKNTLTAPFVVAASALSAQRSALEMQLPGLSAAYWISMEQLDPRDADAWEPKPLGDDATFCVVCETDSMGLWVSLSERFLDTPAATHSSPSLTDDTLPSAPLAVSWAEWRALLEGAYEQKWLAPCRPLNPAAMSTMHFLSGLWFALLHQSPITFLHPSSLTANALVAAVQTSNPATPPHLDASSEASAGTLTPPETQRVMWRSLTAPSHRLLVLAGQDASTLRQRAEQVADDAGGVSSLASLCFQTQTEQEDERHRVAWVCASLAGAQAGIARFLAEHGDRHRVEGIAKDERPPRVAFLFSGQGALYPQAGHDLFLSQPVFRQAFLQCAALLDNKLAVPLTDALFDQKRAKSCFQQATYVQPMLFSLQYALACLWRSWGVEPVAVMGHSLGEYAAAHWAGAMSLEQALSLVHERGLAMDRLPAGGSMAAILAETTQVESLARDYGLDVAAYNTPTNTVVSGDVAGVDALRAFCAEHDIATRALQVTHAFHSALMEPILDDFELAATQVEFLPLQLPLISNLTGVPLPPRSQLDAWYWRRHIREPVQFNKGVLQMQALDCDMMIEIGPEMTLLRLGRRVLKAQGQGQDVRWLPSLRNEQAPWSVILQSLAQLYVRGATIDWLGVAS